MTERSKHNPGDAREREFVVLVVLHDGTVGWAKIDEFHRFVLVDSILDAEVMCEGTSGHAGYRLSRNKFLGLIGTYERLELLPGDDLRGRLVDAASRAAELALHRQGRPGLQRWRASNELAERACRAAIEEASR